ncbi:unnamed protein product, partial [Cyprideis torosa]
EKAEQTIRNKLKSIEGLKRSQPGLKVGVLGCMAERLKQKFLEEEHIVDLVAGPDAYRDIPSLLEEIGQGNSAVNVLLSKEETYGDIAPVRLSGDGVKAFVSITRGCDNMCSFCVVPFTRGRERSRDPNSIVDEIGQAQAQDMDLDVLYAMAKHDNICKHIHLPVQSGSTRILNRMNRQHSREEYMALIDNIRRILPDCALSHDIICGFSGETEADHEDTLSLMSYVKYDFGYMFAYSERPGTPAYKKFADDVPEEVKKRRLQEVIDLQNKHSLERMQSYVGKTLEILIEGDSRKSEQDWCGRSSQNAMVVFPKSSQNHSKGDLVQVNITDCTQATLFGEII